MEVSLSSISFSSVIIRDCKPKICHGSSSRPRYSTFWFKSPEQGRNKSLAISAVPETAASVLLAAAVVGAAATYLFKTMKAPETTNVEDSLRTCEDCGGSGICPECKGEGFVLRRLSDEKAEKARLTAKNMATRYTAGLPKKWSYCTKCSSARACRTCEGRGRLV